MRSRPDRRRIWVGLCAGALASLHSPGGTGSTGFAGAQAHAAPSATWSRSAAVRAVVLPIFDFPAFPFPAGASPPTVAPAGSSAAAAETSAPPPGNGTVPVGAPSNTAPVAPPPSSSPLASPATGAAAPSVPAGASGAQAVGSGTASLSAAAPSATRKDHDGTPEGEGGAHPGRPRLSVGVGMGVSRESASSGQGGGTEIPAFEAHLNVGEGQLGFESRLFSSQGSGRRGAGVDRLALDLMIAVRPLAGRYRGTTTRWVGEVSRLLTLNAGLAAEHAAAGQQVVWRGGFVVGGHADLPLSPVSDPSQLRLRVAVRRMSGRSRAGNIGSTAIGDSAIEAFAGLVVAF